MGRVRILDGLDLPVRADVSVPKRLLAAVLCVLFGCVLSLGVSAEVRAEPTTGPTAGLGGVGSSSPEHRDSGEAAAAVEAARLGQRVGLSEEEAFNFNTMAVEATIGGATSLIPGVGAIAKGAARVAEKRVAGNAIARAAKSGPKLIRAGDVRFTQDSAGATFKGGRSVFDLADEMSPAGGAPSSMPPIRIFKRDGNIHSLDNRRLFAGQYADVSLPSVWASPAEVAARNQTQIFGGTSINIRMGGGVKAWWQHE